MLKRKAIHRKFDSLLINALAVVVVVVVNVILLFKNKSDGSVLVGGDDV